MAPEEGHLSLTYDTHFSVCVQETSLFFYFFSSFLSYQASVSRAPPNGKPQNKANPEGRVAALPHHHPDSAVTSHADCTGKAGSLYNVTLGLTLLNTRFDASSPIISTTYKFGVCDAESGSFQCWKSPRESQVQAHFTAEETQGRREKVMLKVTQSISSNTKLSAQLCQLSMQLRKAPIDVLFFPPATAQSIDRQKPIIISDHS